MSPGALIALAVLLGAAALWELAGSRGEELGRSMRGAAATLAAGAHERWPAPRCGFGCPSACAAPDWPRASRWQP